MKSILLSGTTAVLLMAASGAFAQQDQHQNDNHAGQADDHAGQKPADHPGGDQHMNGPTGNTPSSDNHGNNGFDHGSTGPANNTTATHTTTHRTRHTTTHSTSTTSTNDNNHSSNGFDHNGQNNNNDHNGANNNDHANNTPHPHAQIDVRLKITVNATHHFHAPAYRAPRGYVYRRYTVGARLESAFYAQDYWLADYATYDLIAPPDGYTWVRFGPDAILIDEDTGEVVQVQYGVFI